MRWIREGIDSSSVILRHHANKRKRETGGPGFCDVWMSERRNAGATRQGTASRLRVFVSLATPRRGTLVRLTRAVAREFAFRLTWALALRYNTHKR